MSDRDEESKLSRLGLAMMIGSMIAGLSAMWWWALLGMSEQIAEAMAVTVGISWFAGRLFVRLFTDDDRWLD